MRRAGLLMAVALFALAAVPAHAKKPTPIPQLAVPPPQKFKGAPANPRPINGVPSPPLRDRR